MFIRVVPYDPFWEVEYENESQKIKNILKDILVEVYHIGSTAVKGLAAKSIIDIMPVVTNISLVDKHNKEFVAIGYECMGEFGIEGRRYFRKGGDNRTHQIHIFEQSNHKDINRHIAVRVQKTEQTVTAKTAMLLQFRRGKVNVFFLNYHLLR